MKTWIIAACIAWMMACAGAAIAADKPVAQDGALRAEVVEAMAKLDFATLDARADALLSSRERLPDGRWKQQMLLSFLGDDMQYRCHDDACRRALMSAVEAYDRAHPGSHNAGLFHALALEREGWAARGSGYADSVSKEGWKIFRTRMEQARTVLDQRRKAMASNPAWYANRIDVSRVLDESSEQARDLLEGGIRVEPRYFQLYFNGVDREDPRWGGSVAATLRFINDYGRRAPAADEEGLYARLLWHVICCTPEVDVDPALDWAAARRSIDAIVRDYPVQRNIQRYFLMSCEHADKAETRKLAALLQDPVVDDTIQPEHLGIYEECRAWASGKIPEFVLREPQLGIVRRIR